MFRNLFFQSRRFRDFNFTDCLGRVESVSNRSLSHQIRAAYNAGPPDPCFVDTIALSLRLETSARFLKSVDLPLEPRDYLLSKLFQFLYLPLTIQNQLDEPDALPLRQRLELWLDGLPETAVPRLYRFDWFAFFDDSNRLDRSEVLAGIDRYLPVVRRKRGRSPWMGRRGPVPDVVSYQAVARAVRSVGEGWTRRPGLQKLAERLDEMRYPTPLSWSKLVPPATCWRSAAEAHPKRVVKIVEYRLNRLRALAGRRESIRQGE